MHFSSTVTSKFHGIGTGFNFHIFISSLLSKHFGVWDFVYVKLKLIQDRNFKVSKVEDTYLVKILLFFMFFPLPIQFWKKQNPSKLKIIFLLPKSADCLTYLPLS